MIRLMTREFAKWATKHGFPISDLATVLGEVEAGSFEADLSGHVAIKNEYGFMDKAKAEAAEPLFASRKTTGQFLCTVMPKTKKGM
jgi:hypothetical protein